MPMWPSHSAGASTIQVWDLYSGLQVQIFRPKLSVGSMEDHYITALAAGTLHGHQVDYLPGPSSADLTHSVDLAGWCLLAWLSMQSHVS